MGERRRRWGHRKKGAEGGGRFEMSIRRHWLNRCSFLIPSQPITLSNCAAQRPCVTVYNLLSENPHVRRRKKNQNPPRGSRFLSYFSSDSICLISFFFTAWVGLRVPTNTHLSRMIAGAITYVHGRIKKTLSVKKEMEDEIWKFEKKKNWLVSHSKWE